VKIIQKQQCDSVRWGEGFMTKPGRHVQNHPRGYETKSPPSLEALAGEVGYIKQDAFLKKLFLSLP